MLDPNVTRCPTDAPTTAPPPSVIRAAKWPPDDDDLPAGPPGGGVPAGGGGGDDFIGPGEGDFKSGRFKPIAALVFIAVLIGGGLFFFLGVKQSAEELSVEQAMERKKAVLILPEGEQGAKWAEYAAPEKFGGQGGDELRRSALKQLALLEDDQGVQLAIQALQDPEVTIRAQAATVLAWYGSPKADSAKPALLKLLQESDKGEAPQVAWALVELGESQAFDKVIDLYRKGHLSKVQRIDGVNAFDPEKVVKLISVDQLAAMHADESPAVRQLVATVLSRLADPKYTDALIKLVQDQDIEVARQAAPGLGKIGNDNALNPLLAALEKADKDSREKYLHALRDGIGAQGLVLALKVIDKVSDFNKRWGRTKAVFELTRELADPRGGDHLVKYLETDPHIHWQTEAAIALAEVGDIRAVDTLAKRLRMDPLKIYSDENDWEQMLKRDDKERVICARMLADLAYLHPDKHEEIREKSADAVNFWINELPSPHANGLRALARMKVDNKEYLKQLRDWADPKENLPLEGQQPPMPEEWVIAQSALRYVGMLKDEDSWKTLEKQLGRRPADVNATMDSLMGGGLAILGMTLRALGKGASEGFAEWGDPKAFPMLLEYVEDDDENEQGRQVACQSMAWVATEENMKEVIEKLKEWNDTGDAKQQFRRACLLETLITKPVDGTQSELAGLISPDIAIETRHQAARALGKAGFNEEIQSKLFEMLKEDTLMVDAALALVLGGDTATAKRAVAVGFFDKAKKPALDDLQDLYFKSFGYWSHDDLEKGHIFRWVDNAQAISELEYDNTPMHWARALLEKQFDNLHFDNGPHSFTRVVLRHRLWQMALKDDAKRQGAINTLKFMKEKGVLLALREEKGDVGKLAKAAYHELLNPKIVTGVKIPEGDGK